MWYLYIIEAISIIPKKHGNIKLYTGISQNPVRRFHEHRCWKRYYNRPGWFEKTKRKPRRFVYLEKLGNILEWEAQEYEKKVKRYSKARKLKLIKEWHLLYPDLVLALKRKCTGGL